MTYNYPNDPTNGNDLTEKCMKIDGISCSRTIVESVIKAQLAAVNKKKSQLYFDFSRDTSNVPVPGASLGGPASQDAVDEASDRANVFADLPGGVGVPATVVFNAKLVFLNFRNYGSVDEPVVAMPT
jgi:hypothetical protein